LDAVSDGMTSQNFNGKLSLDTDSIFSASCYQYHLFVLSITEVYHY